MTKIESRPVREGTSRHFDYFFYLDLIGGMGDHNIQNALRQLQVLCDVQHGLLLPIVEVGGLSNTATLNCQCRIALSDDFQQCPTGPSCQFRQIAQERLYSRPAKAAERVL